MQVDCPTCGLSANIACSECGDFLPEFGRGSPIDTRWRPMRTAPRDGTVVELREGGHTTNASYHEVINIHKVGTGQSAWGGYRNLDPAAWRPAHPEWNEDPDAG